MITLTSSIQLRFKEIRQCFWGHSTSKRCHTDFNLSHSNTHFLSSNTESSGWMAKSHTSAFCIVSEVAFEAGFKFGEPVLSIESE